MHIAILGQIAWFSLQAPGPVIIRCLKRSIFYSVYILWLDFSLFFLHCFIWL